MTTDYDRISADDLSCQTEDRLDHTEGEQTTDAVKGRAKRAKGAAKSSSARTSSAQKSVRKTTKTTKTRSVKTATKAQARAQAKQRAEDQLILRQQIETVFGDGAAHTAKQRAAQKRAAKHEATGLVWTLSALALAACGGGGGGSPAPVTGGQGQVTKPVTGGVILPPVPPEQVSDDILNQRRDQFLEAMQVVRLRRQVLEPVIRSAPSLIRAHLRLKQPV